MADTIGVGIIGANPDRGWALTVHIPALIALPDYELRAISTTRQETATAAGKKFNVPLVFDNYAELVTHPDVDLVTVAVKVSHHRELVLAALEAGKHGYCEWPLGINLAEALEIADLARRKHVHTAIGLQGRGSPWINKVRDLIAEGFVGKVLSTRMIASGEEYNAAVSAEIAGLLYQTRGANLLNIQFSQFVDTVCYCLGEFTPYGDACDATT